MKTIIATLLCAFLVQSVLARTPGESLKALDPSHPRLFFKDAETAALMNKISADSALNAVYTHLLASADAMMELEPIKHELEGRRLLGESRTGLRRVSYLAFAYRMTDDDRYLRRAEKEMLAAAAFEDWNPSHFLDVAEMTAALAIGYDWLYNDLDPAARDTIGSAINEKGLIPSMDTHWWQMSNNNWNQVCHGGMVLGALALYEKIPELAEQIIARAIKSVPNAMAEYEPDGVYPEGPSYWAYGTTYNVILIDALESALGSDFGLAARTGFMRSPEFYLFATGPTGLFYNFSDCGTRGSAAPAMHWFAKRAQDSSLLWQEGEAIQRLLSQDPSGKGASDRVLPFLLLWAHPTQDIDAPQQLHWKGDGRTPIALHRSGWDPSSTFIGIKGGSPSTNHAHMDIGSFVLDMGGVRWAIDLGAQDYHSLESKGIDLWNKTQESQRWTVFRLSSQSHNTLVVNNQLQQVKGNAPILRFSDTPNAPFTVVDMTPVYEGQLKRALRGAQLFDRSVVIQDDVEALEQDTRVRWGMMTNAQVSITEGNKATLEQDGQAMTLEVLAPQNATLQRYETETPPHDYDSKNPNTRMIGFEIDVAPASKETLRVFFHSDATEHAPALPESMEKW